jgi:hypothetical protein
MQQQRTTPASILCTYSRHDDDDECSEFVANASNRRDALIDDGESGNLQPWK